MALINCPECSAEVSDSALTCAKCGVQLRKPQRGIFGKIIKYTFILFNIFMGWWLVAGMQAATKAVLITTETQPASANAVALAPFGD